MNKEHKKLLIVATKLQHILWALPVSQHIGSLRQEAFDNLFEETEKQNQKHGFTKL